MNASAWTGCRGEQVDPATTLLPCTERPNCVSTDHPDPERRLPLADDVALAQLRAAILSEPRSDIVAEGPHWLIAHFRSRVFGFVDEAHFIFRADGRLAMRSGACSGYYDFGVNRRRLERLLAKARQNAED
ncbi:DUF1499 domain-containing protein [Nitrogeniibacter mangrovi]|uniref:DUF1499 domain-containing protein n=2 Tax=Nitrogeniibacter mangrovi TaxID=2016596 RepID=A0A6C1BB89_9RHOO|nr:DUF1499 domain-containing protein [Nitrogeniibacter mangrovi]